MKKVLLSILICSTFVLAKQHTSHTYAYVTHSQAVYEYKNISRYNNSYENNRQRSNYNSIGLDTIVGGTIGVIIGNQIGRGNGKTAAKIVGGLLGAAVANNARYDSNEYSHNNYDSGKNRHNHRSKKQRVLVGYENYFIYKNQEFSKFSKHRKNRIKITETINF